MLKHEPHHNYYSANLNIGLHSFFSIKFSCYATFFLLCKAHNVCVSLDQQTKRKDHRYSHFRGGIAGLACEVHRPNWIWKRSFIQGRFDSKLIPFKLEHFFLSRDVFLTLTSINSMLISFDSYSNEKSLNESHVWNRYNFFHQFLVQLNKKKFLLPTTTKNFLFNWRHTIKWNVMKIVSFFSMATFMCFQCPNCVVGLGAKIAKVHFIFEMLQEDPKSSGYFG